MAGALRTEAGKEGLLALLAARRPMGATARENDPSRASILMQGRGGENTRASKSLPCDFAFFPPVEGRPG